MEEVPSPGYTDFHHQVASAQSIRFCSSPYSSQAYPAPITDGDLLAEVGELLDQVHDLRICRRTWI